MWRGQHWRLRSLYRICFAINHFVQFFWLDDTCIMLLNYTKSQKFISKLSKSSQQWLMPLALLSRATSIHQCAVLYTLNMNGFWDKSWSLLHFVSTGMVFKCKKKLLSCHGYFNYYATLIFAKSFSELHKFPFLIANCCAVISWRKCIIPIQRLFLYGLVYFPLSDSTLLTSVTVLHS
jgi:hypothetical protein